MVSSLAESQIWQDASTWESLDEVKKGVSRYHGSYPQVHANVQRRHLEQIIEIKFRLCQM